MDRREICNKEELCRLLLTWPEETIALWVGVGRRILFAESAYKEGPPLYGELVWREVVNKNHLVARAVTQALTEGSCNFSKWWPWPSVHGLLSPSSFPALPEEEEPFPPEIEEVLCEVWAVLACYAVSRQVTLTAQARRLDLLTKRVSK